MNISRTLSTALVGVFAFRLLPLAAGFGQTTAATVPVGILQTQCLANSDTLVALPFTRPPAFTGTVASVSGAGSNILSFSMNPAFTAGQFVFAPTAATPVTDHFYLIVGPTRATVAGTVSVTQGLPTVVGTGTTFTTQLSAGDRLTINDGYNLLTYTVVSVDSDTGLTLDRPFADSAAGGTASGNAVSHTVATNTAQATVLAPPKVSRHSRPPRLAPAITGLKTGVASVPVTRSVSGALTGLLATFDHSPYEGRWYMVTANDLSTVTVNLNGDTLPASLPNTQVSIIPCWTLNTLFPASNANVSFTASPDIFTLQTEILIPDYTSAGTNLASTATYFFLNGGSPSTTGWRLYGDFQTTDHGNDFLLPDGYFTVRNSGNAPGLPVTFNGSVATNKLVTALAVSTLQAQDNAVGLNRPVGVPIKLLGLNPSDNSFQASSSPLNVTDELLVFDNTSAAVNRASSATYYYINDGGSNVGWRLYGDFPTTDHGSDIILAASALIVRKAAVAATATAPVWSNVPNY